MSRGTGTNRGTALDERFGDWAAPPTTVQPCGGCARRIRYSGTDPKCSDCLQREALSGADTGPEFKLQV